MANFIPTLLFLLVLVVNLYACSGGDCRESERMALLDFKAELIDDDGRLSSWGISNCCGWKGVVCDNRTNHVVALGLHPPSDAAAPLGGKISPSLLQLPHLQYLDLSLNDFGGTTIPNFIGSMSKLQHLNLSHCSFLGLIPPHIGNLSALTLLDLSFNILYGNTNLDWLSGSQSLQYLDLSYASLQESTTWLQVIHKLTALKEIHLSACQLQTVVTFSDNSSNSLAVLDLSFNYLNYSTPMLTRFLNMSTSFTYIDLSSNYLEGSISDAFGKLTSLSHLHLQYNNLVSSIPGALGNLTSLSYLDLSHNSLGGEFPRPSKNLNSLTYLDLSWNKFNGQLPHLVAWLQDSTRLKYLSLGHNLLSGSFPNMSRFSFLEELYLENNRLNGALPEANLILPNLETLDLSRNMFMRLSEDISRLPNLVYLDLSRNKFIGRLPNLSSSQSLIVLDLSKNAFNGSLIKSIEHLCKIDHLHAGHNQFEGVITEAHLWRLPRLTILDLSFNLNITLRINSSWLHPAQFQVLNLANCKLEAHFPSWLHNQNQLQFLDISNCRIFDTIPAWFWGNFYVCNYLNMSHNRIHGVLPNLSSTVGELTTLDLSSNGFTGPLPHLPPINNIDLSRNRFLGTILAFCNFQDMYLLLDLSNNLLSGEIPEACFSNLLSLGYLNLANNNFSGKIPTTSRTSYIFSLHLRNNRFRGDIQSSLMNCSELRILDLGGNEFSGKIPSWLGESMPNLGVLILKSNMFYGSLPSSICHLAYLQVLDISSNKITGSIPNCMHSFTLLSSNIDSDSWSNLFASQRNDSYAEMLHDSASVIWKGNQATYINTLGLLKMIDLSSNELSGGIPHEITNLIGLLGLNLSHNSLVGLLPQDIDRMTLFNFLDLSRNKLSGSIPTTLSKLNHLGVLDLSFNNFSGRIPWDTHMETFAASSYSGNLRLCGPPLLSRPCPEDEHEKVSDSEDVSRLITRGFYISLLLGFVLAFWFASWTLFFNKWWTAAVLKIYITVGDWLYVQILVNKRRFFTYFCNAS